LAFVRGYTLLGLTAGLFFLGTAGWGFRAGVMPGPGFEIDRQQSAAMFWLFGVLYCAMAAIALVAVATDLLG
jgi:hypothetical protein